MGTLKRLLRYLSGTRSFGITYSVPNIPAASFIGFADVAYANTDDQKSTFEYIFIVAGGAITWRSKEQETIALSSMEAEYIALSEAVREACWLRNLHNELGFLEKTPTIIKGDNDRSIAMAQNPQFHKRSKHVDIYWHWIREKVQDGEVSIGTCQDPTQTADVLTKVLTRPKHRQHILEMGLMQV